MRFPKRIRLPHDAYGNAEAVFHVVFRAMPGTRPFADPPRAAHVWELFTNEVTASRVKPLVACLMPDHLHCVISPRERDIVKWANGFKSYSTRMDWRLRGTTALWQPGFFDRLIRDEAEFRTAVEYVLRNPVQAGLVGDSDEWPWLGAWLEDQT